MSSPSAPAGIYVHIPFCSAICPYCDFAVVTGDGERRSRYVDDLLVEMELACEQVAPADTLYLGGGTPSALAVEDIERIIAGACRLLPLEEEPWIAMEVNPEDVSGSSARAWRELGVRRLSVGVQALDFEALRFLGRRHDSLQALRSIEICRDSGFDSVSVDLIYGLPVGAEGRWRRTLEQVVELGPDHLSCYELTIHDGTPFGRWAERGRLRVLGDARKSELFVLTHELLAENGYPGYEISNFARSPEHRSRHNLKYWQHVPYLGLGLGAHSFDGARRSWNERDMAAYSARIGLGVLPVAASEVLTVEQLRLEALLMGLRTHEGIDLERFRERYDFDLMDGNLELVERLVGKGRLRLEDGHLIPTLEGMLIADALAVSFTVESA